MAINQIPYIHWGTSGINSRLAKFETCSASLRQLYTFMHNTFGGLTLGCHNQRTVAGSSTLSPHAYGAALDVRFPNRQITLAVCQWLVHNSRELGINAIHDYLSQKIWKSGNPNAHPDLWPRGNIGSVGGTWIHVETTLAMFDDGRSVQQKLAGVAPPPGNPLPPPGVGYDPWHHNYGLWPLNTAKPSLAFGFGYTNGTQQHQGTCTYFNHVCIFEAGQSRIVPPYEVILQPSIDAMRNLRAFFDPQSTNHAWAVEAWNGVIGPETWKIVDFLASR
jgi:hypothetical protein